MIFFVFASGCSNGGTTSQGNAGVVSVTANAPPWCDADWQLALRCNGDRSQDLVLTTLQMLQNASPNPDARFRVEHFIALEDEAEVAQYAARVKALNVDVGHTIGHVFFWGQVFNDTLLGPTVSKNIDPIAPLMAAGCIVATHSDSPVTTPMPMRNVQIALKRLWQPGAATEPDRAGPLPVTTMSYSLGLS